MPFFLNIDTEVNSSLRLISLAGRENVSQPFQFQLELVADRSDIEFAEFIGQKVKFSIWDEVPEEMRHFSGYVSHFATGQGDASARTYHITVVPWFWLLSCTSDCRIFQKKTVKQIIDDVFSTYDFADYQFLSLQEEYRKWEYCVQYNETDMDFVSRLLEQEGMFYFFKHTEEGHTMVIGDGISHYVEIPDSDVRMTTSPDEFDTIREDGIDDWDHRYSFIPASQSQTDYNFIESPSKNKTNPASLLLKSLSTRVEINNHSPKFDIFQYPGEYTLGKEGDHYVKVRMEDDEVDQNIAGGSGQRKTFAGGYTFNLVNHTEKIENTSYVLLSVQHSATDNDRGMSSYNNSFTCIPATVVFRPDYTTPKPSISGVQTAVVVGPEGEEIYADQYGRVQVQFFWDRYGERKPETTCYIRCAQAIAGKNWGSMFIPRIGQEVVVTFINGDPDRPLITGVVYNSEQMPAYDPKTEGTKSYIKTNTSPGGEGYNELCFDDAKDNERLYLHASRNMDVRVRNDSLNRTFGNRHQIIGWEKDGEKGGDQNEMIYQDKNQNIKRNHVEHIEGNKEVLIGNGDADDGGKLDIVIENKKTESIGADGYHLAIEGDRNEEVGGAVSLGCGDHNETNSSYALESEGAVHIKGSSVVIEADSQLSIKVGGSYVDISSAMVAITGSTVLINSGGSAGSGSGASLTAPDSATEAAPTEPEIAHSDDSGIKSAPESLEGEAQELL